MNISYPSSTVPVSTAGAVTTVNATTSSTTIAVASPNRLLGGLIVNKGTKKLWVRFDSIAATTASPCVDVPPNGGSIDIPDGYVGAVTGTWETGATGAATVIEFSAF
jgi:hypothetical protein